MIGRMKFHGVEAKPSRIECSQLGRILVRCPRELEHLRRAPASAELGQRRGFLAAAIGSDRIPQRPIAAIKVDIDLGRRLVESLVHS